MENVTYIDVVKGARNLIANSGWCKVALARDARRKPIDPKSSDAVAFCSLGAIERSAHDLGVEPGSDVIDEAQLRLAACIPAPVDSLAEIVIYELNDAAPNRKYVLNFFDEAIARGELNDLYRSVDRSAEADSTGLVQEHYGAGCEAEADLVCR